VLYDILPFLQGLVLEDCTFMGRIWEDMDVVSVRVIEPINSIINLHRNMSAE